MTRAIVGLDRVVVITLVSKTGMPLRVPTAQVFSNALGIFATSLSSHLALLSSSIHFFWWTTKSELRTDPRYTPSDGFETFPQPELTDRMNRAGGDLDTFRLELTERRRLGLTALYQLVNDEAVH